MIAWIVVGASAILLAALLVMRLSKPDATSGEEVADVIERFIDDRCESPWEWDDFISVRIADRALDDIREQCASTRDRFPPSDGKGWCSPEGVAELKRLAEEARGHRVRSN
jgi:hypothetical protein